MTSFVLALVLATSGTHLVTLSAPLAELDTRPLRSLPVLHEGRIKPLEVVAREVVYEVHGSSVLPGLRDPLQSLVALTLHADTLSWQPVLPLEHRELREALDLDPQGRWISPLDLRSSEAFGQLLAQAHNRYEANKRLTTVDRKVLQAAKRLEAFERIAVGEPWRMLPGPENDRGRWRFWMEVDPESADTLVRRRARDLAALLTAAHAANGAALELAARRLNPDVLLTDATTSFADGSRLHTRTGHLEAELLLVDGIRPFRLGWIVLALASIFGIAALTLSVRRQGAAQIAARSAWALSAVALMLLATGFALGTVAAGRAPVTNSFEIILVACWGALLSGGILAWRYRLPGLLLASNVMGLILFVIADSVPVVLDPSISPLAPDLRSSIWLSLYLLTVVASHAAFLVAMVVGNAGLGLAWRRHAVPSLESELAHYACRAMTLGVLLLAAGILLGGGWADGTRGRFWGWDPMETWSLITALGGLALLWARFTGKVGAPGTLAGAVLVFCGILIAWTSGGFLLTSGLQTVGTSKAGVMILGVYVAVQSSWVVACALRRRRQTLIEHAVDSP